mgnify:FL=1
MVASVSEGAESSVPAVQSTLRWGGHPIGEHRSRGAGRRTPLARPAIFLAMVAPLRSAI